MPDLPHTMDGDDPMPWEIPLSRSAPRSRGFRPQSRSRRQWSLLGIAAEEFIALLAEMPGVQCELSGACVVAEYVSPNGGRLKIQTAFHRVGSGSPALDALIEDHGRHAQKMVVDEPRSFTEQLGHDAVAGIDGAHERLVDAAAVSRGEATDGH